MPIPAAGTIPLCALFVVQSERPNVDSFRIRLSFDLSSSDYVLEDCEALCELLCRWTDFTPTVDIVAMA